MTPVVTHSAELDQQEDWCPGDVVFCPGRGIGTIVSRHRRAPLGVTREYLTIDIPKYALKIMLPVDAAAESGLRRPACRQELEQALNALGSKPPAPSSNWRTRVKRNHERLADGSPAQIAEVVCELALLGGSRGLAHHEREIYRTARELLEAELALGFGIDDAEAARQVDGRLGLTGDAADRLLSGSRRS